MLYLRCLERFQPKIGGGGAGSTQGVYSTHPEGLSKSGWKKPPKDKVLGEEVFLGHQGPTRRDIP